MNKQSLAKQNRIDSILLSLKKLDYLTRSQIQQLHDLKSVRNANRILKDMSQYLSSFTVGVEHVYYLNKEGRERVRSDVERRKTANIKHFILRNQLYIYLKCPETWKNEVKMKAGETYIVCDAKFMMNNIPAIVEVDCSQTMAKNEEKIEKYRKIKELTGQPFNLIWITELESRRESLRELMEGLTGRVYTLNDIR
ncbi:replication-relaxation family protein [Chungangia koreensis]|uniref:Replication-relaxation family protein n=1 Tax=Chungangia koreensis TaxID=752657 RepID=A0ABV8X0F9_9LACT